MKKILVFAFLLVGISAFAQDRKPNKNVGGQFSLGVRSTISLFSDAGSSMGTGAGGQFRIRLYNFMNTEWFGDYLMSSIGTIGTRTDYHIGWSVMFYSPKQKPFKKYHPKPYFLTGHCFDYTRIAGNNPFYQDPNHSVASRWSSAVQAGLGFHIPFCERVDLSLSAQYMFHLGKDITAVTRTAVNGDEFLYIDKEEASINGHLLISFSLNIRCADLWHDHQKKGGARKAAPDPDGQNPKHIEQ
ncbi:MAG: hypothetical protein NT084_04100 [Bacteroidetes bacterium]|nr:hypothetical protein [Bacteroidota bacterium]